MMRFLLLVLLIYAESTYAQQTDSSFIKTYETLESDRVSARFIEQIYQGQSLTEYLDNYVDDIHVHLETTAGYDQPNPYLNAFTGASYKWTNYSYDGIRINNPLIAGDAAYHFPLEYSGITIDRISRTINVLPGEKKKSLRWSNTFGNIGGRVGFTDWFINNISMHPSAKDREILEINHRPSTPWSTELSWINTQSDHPFQFHLVNGSRIHVDQDYKGTSTPYTENYSLINGKVRLSARTNPIGEGIHLLLNARWRSHAGGELNFNQNETTRQNQQHITLYTKGENQSAAIGLSHLGNALNETLYHKNVIDQDGEGMMPLIDTGNQWAASLSYNRTHPITEKLGLHLNTHNRLIHKSDNTSFYNVIYLKSVIQDSIPLGYWNWNSFSHTGGLLVNDVTLKYSDKNLQLSGGLHAYGIVQSEKSVLSIDPSIDVRYHIDRGNWDIGLILGSMPNPMDIDQLKFISNKHYNARLSQIFSEPLETFGGAYTQLSDKLRASRTTYFELPIKYKTSKWTWSLTPQYRRYSNTWTVAYQDETFSGVFHQVGDRSVWYPRNRFSKYIVVPYDKSRMTNPDGSDNGWLFSQPFYAGATFRFEHKTDKWYFSGSFTANMIMGASGFGNGPIDNNINSLSIHQANPNFRNHQLGRLDSDRSFISRLIASYKLNDDHRLTLQLKYKDGQSFANYDYFVQYIDGMPRVAFVPREVRGDNPFSGIMGRREDFFSNLELKGQHRVQIGKAPLTLRWAIHNLFDFANETSEYTFGNQNGYDRAPLELHVPRSVRIGLIWEM